MASILRYVPQFALRSRAPAAARSFSSSLRILSAEASASVSGTAGEDNIRSKLQSRFNPSRLDVQDVSGGCGTFYAISIASAEFKGIPMVKQHRLVTEELKKEIEGIHGLQIKTSTDDA